MIPLWAKLAGLWVGKKATILLLAKVLEGYFSKCSIACMHIPTHAVVRICSTVSA